MDSQLCNKLQCRDSGFVQSVRFNQQQTCSRISPSGGGRGLKQSDSMRTNNRPIANHSAIML
jgi:hypothetical protein